LLARAVHFFPYNKNKLLYWISFTIIFFIKLILSNQWRIPSICTIWYSVARLNHRFNVQRICYIQMNNIYMITTYIWQADHRPVSKSVTSYLEIVQWKFLSCC
jgi:hypothetical protein